MAPDHRSDPDPPRPLDSVPELRTEPPSPVEDDEADREPTIWTTGRLPHLESASSRRPGSSAMVTDTESEGGYTSTQSNAPREIEPTRLSVFSRRAPSKSSSENERRTMTIETETVANVFTSSGLKSDHHNRSLKTKLSTDTVRASQQKPKKKKSRVAVVNANHIPTKSEIFAATITQAVDENEDTDSDETFVYESNPRSPRRISRSPSLASVHSLSADRHVSISRLEAGPNASHRIYPYEERDREKVHRAYGISGKRSMKFNNNPYEDDYHRRHVSHTLSAQYRRIQGDESPFVRSPKLRPGLDRRLTSPNSSDPNSPRISRPASPRLPHNYSSSGLKRDRRINPSAYKPWSVYEDEEEGGSSSERSPFLRKRSSRLQERQSRQTRPGDLMSGMPFIMIIICLMLVVCMITAAALSTSQPLRDVKVVNITNVLVSKQELLFDLVVEAYNPNALALTVKDVEISVFAQSPYVRDEDHPKSPHDGLTSVRLRPSKDLRLKTAKEVNRQHKMVPRSFAGFWPPWTPGQNGSEEYPEDEDSTTLLVGRVYEFDSALQFESRFFNRSVSTASGELRVVKPGNITDEGGLETWERVIQHSFELIVRGVMKYQSSSFTKNIRTAELYKSAHINPARLDGPDLIFSESGLGGDK